MTFGLRKKRRPGNRPMTKAEASMVDQAKEGPCVPCLAWWLAGKMALDRVSIGGDWHHTLLGGIRIGHGAGFCNCPWHHRGVPNEGETAKTMEAIYGPSLARGSKPFHAAFGSDATLTAMQVRVLSISTDEFSKDELLALLEAA